MSEAPILSDDDQGPIARAWTAVRAPLRLLRGGGGREHRPAPRAASAPWLGVALDDEARLLSAARRGDGRAFAALVAPHLPMLLRVGARAARDRALGEDAVQEALVIAARDLERYQAGTSLRAWLASIVSARAFTLVRGEARRRARDGDVAWPAAAPRPDEAALGAELASQIDALLAAMPEKRRQAAVLRLDGGLEYAEIALILDSTEASAKALVHLAVKGLREGLADVAAVKTDTVETVRTGGAASGPAAGRAR